MTSSAQNPFRQWIRLEQPRLGTSVVYATDDFFADKSRLIDPQDPVFIPDKYDDNGKWMDGWESRRKRSEGNDFCVVHLGVPGIVRGFNIDTSHFTGNFPPEASIEACNCASEMPSEDTEWREIVPRTKLAGDSHHFVACDDDGVITHVRLQIYPDGGIARLRIYGEVRPNFTAFSADEKLDLLALENGGRALACNDEHFGSMHNLNLPDRGINMGDGWETARRREEGNDWVVLALGHPGIIERIEIDTAHFKGNYPDRAAIQASLVDDANTDGIIDASESWPLLLAEQKLDMDKIHVFTDELESLGPVSHLRLSIFPDGGISRLRVIGKIAS